MLWWVLVFYEKNAQRGRDVLLTIYWNTKILFTRIWYWTPQSILPLLTRDSKSSKRDFYAAYGMHFSMIHSVWTFRKTGHFRTFPYTDHSFWPITRLNFVNFGILFPDQFNPNFYSWVKSALKIIQNDTDIVYEL